MGAPALWPSITHVMLISCFDGLGEVSQVRRSVSRFPQSVATPLQGATSLQANTQITPVVAAAAVPHLCTDGAHTAMVQEHELMRRQACGWWERRGAGALSHVASFIVHEAAQDLPGLEQL